MKKKVLLLLISFTAFYILIYLTRHLPDLARGKFDIGGELTASKSLLHFGADLTISCLFVLFPYLLLHKFYPERKIARMILFILLTVSVCFLTGLWTSQLFEVSHIRMNGYFLQNILPYTIDIIFGMTFYFIQYSGYKELQQKELIIQSRQSELSFLRSQINPHFLFNNLNNIYSLVYQQSDQALAAIAGLSDLLRYMLYDTSAMVPLSKEAAYIEKYILLQKLRFEKPPVINQDLSGDDAILIPSLLLIPFVENAFKHGDISVSGGPITIELKTDNNTIYFRCINKKAKLQKDSTGGIGIENVKRRLEILYPGKHQLEIRDEPDRFTVNLGVNYG
jgi:two-component system LytT family sensor kinase